MKPSIYGLTRQALEDWVLEQGEKNSVPLRFGNGSIAAGSNPLRK